MKLLLTIFAILTPLLVFARVNETREQMTARYGNPANVSTRPIYKDKTPLKVLTWFKPDMMVEAEEYNGRVISIRYTLTRSTWTAEALDAALEKQTRSTCNAAWTAAGVNAWSYRERARALLSNSATLTVRTWDYNTIVYHERNTIPKI